MSVQRAIAAAAKAAKRLSGVTIRYQRGSGDPVELTAVPGSTNYELTDTDGRIITAQSRDYLIVAEDLVLDGEAVEPARGDQITESQVDGDHVYELLELPASKCWRWSDEHHVRYRVHTKEVEKP